MPEAAPIPGPAGPAGAAGPAPAGTGIVSVTAGVLDVPLTLSAGGIVIGGALGVPAVLAAGSAGYVLRMISGAPTWCELSASGLLAARPAATAGRAGQEYWSTDATAGLELSRCVHQGGGAYAWEVVPYGITATGVSILQAASIAAARAVLGLCAVQILPVLAGYVSTTATVDEVIGLVRVDPATYALSGLTTAITIEAIGSVVSGVTGTLTLYNLTGAASAASLTWVETSATRKTASVALPGVVSIYELRFKKSGGAVSDYATIGGVNLSMSWS